MSFVDNFEKLCLDRNVTPTSVCESIGLSNSIYSYWKSKNTKPRQNVIRKLSEYFDVSETELLDGTESKIEVIRKVPVLGRVAAGIPIEAITDIEDIEEFDATAYPDAEFFALRISGDSMLPRINHGDIVIVKQQDYANDGDIVIALINGCDATCKQIHYIESGIELHSFNAAYSTMFFTDADIDRLPVRILGKVVELRAKF